MAEKSVRQEGYLRERYHYFHLKDTMGQERDFHFHDFDKIVILLSGKVEYLVEDETYALSAGRSPMNGSSSTWTAATSTGPFRRCR